MRSFLKKYFQTVEITKSIVLNSCQRWSILLPFLLYLTFFITTKIMQVPLRSVDNPSGASIFMRRMAEKGGQMKDSGYGLDLDEDVIIGSEKDKPEPQVILQEIFHKADVNNDGQLSTDELSSWINTQTQEHIQKAIVENYGIFTAIDIHPRNGVISWEEYHYYFLHKNGLSKTYIKNHNEKHRELNRSMKEAIMRDRAAWSEAAKTDPEHLTLDEFLAFRHPESSHATILALVDELYEKFDRDGDEILTEDEFSTLQTDNENDNEKSEIITQGEAERRREFREVIDRNNDGKANRKELLMYIDPKNPRHAKEEAETLVVLADMNHDGKLSLFEVLNKMDLFLGSKMVDTARSFHDEF